MQQIRAVLRGTERYIDPFPYLVTHVVSNDQLTQTSLGALVVTNKRIALQPAPGNKPVSIPLNKVLSYNAHNNGIEVHKEGREKGYFFLVKDSGGLRYLRYA